MPFTLLCAPARSVRGFVDRLRIDDFQAPEILVCAGLY